MLQSPILIEALLSLLYSKIKLDALAVFVEVQVSWLKPIGSQNAFYRNHRQFGMPILPCFVEASL